MCKAWKCDKCGRYYLESRKIHELRTYEDNSNIADKHYDLCDDCKKKFDKWIETKPYLGTDWTFLAMAEAPIYSSKDVTPYGWPVFEDGTPIKEWDEVLDQNGHGFVAHSFCHYGTWWSVSSSHGYATRSNTGVFKRPTKDQMTAYYKKWPVEREKAYFAKIPRFKADAKTTHDSVDHPKHYDNGTVECIDWIEERLSPEEFKGYLLGNALKYVYRYEGKGKPVEDLRKAQWYLKKMEELA